MLAGAYRRQCELASDKIVIDTETRCVTVITPTLFCDLRISPRRPQTFLAGTACASHGDLSNEELAELARHTHCFCGCSEACGVSPAGPLVNRSHALDWQPMPRLRPNRWVAEPKWSSGGWVEWGMPDANGNPRYIEHWLTLSGSREGPFLSLRRLPRIGGDADGYFLIAGDHFALALARPIDKELPIVTPGQDGHPADRGRVEPLVDAALSKGDRHMLLAINAMEVHYGRIRHQPAGCQETHTLTAGGGGVMSDDAARGDWTILLSSMPWKEGSSLKSFVQGLSWQANRSSPLDALPSVLEAAEDGSTWRLFEAVGVDDKQQLRTLLS